MILTKSDVMKGINMISPYRFCVLSEHHLLKPVHDTNYLILFQVLFKALIPIYTVISIPVQFHQHLYAQADDLSH